MPEKETRMETFKYCVVTVARSLKFNILLLWYLATDKTIRESEGLILHPRVARALPDDPIERIKVISPIRVWSIQKGWGFRHILLMIGIQVGLAVLITLTVYGFRAIL